MQEDHEWDMMTEAEQADWLDALYNEMSR